MLASDEERGWWAATAGGAGRVCSGSSAGAEGAVEDMWHVCVPR